jgi:hypothetical protein
MKKRTKLFFCLFSMLLIVWEGNHCIFENAFSFFGKNVFSLEILADICHDSIPENNHSSSQDSHKQGNHKHGQMHQIVAIASTAFALVLKFACCLPLFAFSRFRFSALYSSLQSLLWSIFSSLLRKHRRVVSNIEPTYFRFRDSLLLSLAPQAPPLL